MSRSSRFSKLESERAGAAAAQPTSGASLERFAAEPELGPRAEPVDPSAPQHGAERLRRFEDDGAEGLALDRDPLAALPMLECPCCGIGCGKFERVCHGCQASLTTPLARAHNLKRLEALTAERNASQELERDKLRQEQQEAELRRLQGRSVESRVDPLREEELRGRARRRWWRLGVWVVALGFALFGSGGLRVAGWLIGVVVGMTFIPPSVWVKLGTKVRSRGGW